MPTTTVPSAVFCHPTSGASFQRAGSSGSSRSSLDAGAELGLEARRIFYGASTSTGTARAPEAETTKIQGAADCQLEARRTMMKGFTSLFARKF